MYIYTYLHIHIYLYICISVYVRMYVCIYIERYRQIYIYSPAPGIQPEDLAVVRRLYRSLCETQLRAMSRLSFEGMRPPTPAEAEMLGGCLNNCERLVSLDLQGVGLTDSALQVR